MLLSSEKIRNNSKSTGYGTKLINKKKPKEPEAPTFSPATEFGKKAAALKTASPGSKCVL